MFDRLANRHGEHLDCSFHPGAPERRDVLVIGHGVTANKDRPFLVALAEAVAAAGISALRVSFAGNGASGGRFEEATISKEAEDLGAVLDALDGWRVGYAGHSMGAAVGVRVASGDPRITALVSLAGMVHTQDFAQRKFGELTPDSGDCMWDKPECPLSKVYMDDMAHIHSVVELGRMIHVPWLLVHGSSDTVVPIGDARDILAQAGANAEFVELPEADHVFGGDGATERMVEAVVPWLGRCWGSA